jgi:hypothetical protein
MASSRSLYDDERTLPYWVRLAKVAEENDAVVSKARPMLMFLDFRGGEFTRASADRLADTFEWITKAHRLRVDDLSNYCLTITPIRRDQAEQAIGRLAHREGLLLRLGPGRPRLPEQAVCVAKVAGHGAGDLPGRQRNRRKTLERSMAQAETPAQVLAAAAAYFRSAFSWLQPHRETDQELAKRLARELIQLTDREAGETR